MSNVDIYKEVWLRDIILGLVDKGFLFIFFTWKVRWLVLECHVYFLLHFDGEAIWGINDAMAWIKSAKDLHR